jgi:hypothetical protein
MAKLGNAAAAVKDKGSGGVKAKVIGSLVLAVIAIIVLFNIFNFADTDANKIGLHYGGGVVEDKKFKSIIPPGSTNKLIGPGDTSWAELYNNEAKKSAFQTAAATEFTRLLPAAVGGDYFCGPSYTGNNACGDLSFTVQKPTPLDKGIIDGLEAKQRAELAKATQEQKNQQVNVELQSVKQQVAMLGAQGYLLKTAIESGKIQFMVIPQNGNVSIPVPTTAQTTQPNQQGQPNQQAQPNR